MTKCETRKQLSYSRLGTGITQENGGLNQVLRCVKPPTCMTVVNSSVILTNEKRNKISFYENTVFVVLFVFSSPGQRPCELLPSLGVHPSVVRHKLSHLNLLLWNPWTKLTQTWQGWSLGGSLSKLCPTDSPSIQVGCCY
jgi:hypothetical protein